MADEGVVVLARREEIGGDAVHDVPPQGLHGPERDPAGGRCATSRRASAPTTPATWPASPRPSPTRTSTTSATIWPGCTEPVCHGRETPGWTCRPRRLAREGHGIKGAGLTEVTQPGSVFSRPECPQMSVPRLEGVRDVG